MDEPQNEQPDQGNLSTLTPPSETQRMENSEQLLLASLSNPCAGIIARLREQFPQGFVDPTKVSPEEYARQAKIDRGLREFYGSRGSRYADCRLGNLVISAPTQKAAIDKLMPYANEIAVRIESGDGVVLFGPKGTGKDHLASALCRAAIMAGKSVIWRNGMDLFGDIRDRMEGNSKERDLVRQLVEPDLLYLSDPLPPTGSLTDFQSAMLFRVLDGRYSNRRPCIVTVNVSSGAELEQRLGPQNADRLRDGAMAIFCEWPSFRKAKQ